MLWHQFGNKGFLSHAGQTVSFGEFHTKKMTPDTVPERGMAAVVRHAAHLRNYLAGEILTKCRQKQETDLRQQLPVFAVTAVRIEEQPAKFGITGVIVTTKQRRHRIINI